MQIVVNTNSRGPQWLGKKFPNLFTSSADFKSTFQSMPDTPLDLPSRKEGTGDPDCGAEAPLLIALVATVCSVGNRRSATKDGCKFTCQHWIVYDGG